MLASLRLRTLQQAPTSSVSIMSICTAVATSSSQNKASNKGSKNHLQHSRKLTFAALPLNVPVSCSLLKSQKKGFLDGSIWHSHKNGPVACYNTAKRLPLSDISLLAKLQYVRGCMLVSNMSEGWQIIASDA